MTTANVKISDGEIQGKIYETPGGKKYYSFTEIPYAEPPTGKLRFRQPVPVQKWLGVLDATKHDALFLQEDLFFNNIGGQETLILNVYTPSLKNDYKKALPVMVYFHGGGFMMGTCKKDFLGPDFIIEKDVVVVTVQYRIGVLGFLCMDIPEAPGNAGLKDQVLSLEWIQKNISTFSGDPTNVTIFGTSAGGASVDYHILSPMSKNLFHKAISISGNALNPWAISKDPNYFAFRIAEVLEKDLNTKDKLIDFLTTAKSEDINKINSILNKECMEGLRGGLNFAFTPVIEKKFENVTQFLGQKPIDILKAGKQNIVPVITGFGKQEGFITTTMSPQKLSDIQNNQNVSAFLPFDVKDNENLIRDLNLFYKDKESLRLNENSAIEFLGDADFTGGILHAAKLQAINNPSVFLYNFTHSGAFNLCNSSRMKTIFGNNESRNVAGHADPEGYIFYSNDSLIESSPKDKEIREQLLEMFTQFAKTGNPTPHTTPLLTTKWLPVTDNKMNILNIDDEIVLGTEEERPNLWARIYEYESI